MFGSDKQVRLGDLGGQGVLGCADVQAGQLDCLVSASRALEQDDVRFAEIEEFGDVGDESGVGLAVDCGGGERDFQGSVVDAGDGVASGSRMDAEGERAAFGVGAQVGEFGGHGWIRAGILGRPRNDSGMVGEWAKQDAIMACCRKGMNRSLG